MLERMMVYMKDNKFKAFVDDYAFKHRTTVEGAINCITVKEYFDKHYKAHLDA